MLSPPPSTFSPAASIPDDMAFVFEKDNSPLRDLSLTISLKRNYVLLRFHLPAGPSTPLTSEEDAKLVRMYNEAPVETDQAIREAMKAGNTDSFLYRSVQRENHEQMERQAIALMEKLNNHPRFHFTDKANIPDAQLNAPDITDDEREECIFIVPAAGVSVKTAYLAVGLAIKQLGGTLDRNISGNILSTDFTLNTGRQ